MAAGKGKERGKTGAKVWTTGQRSSKEERLMSLTGEGPTPSGGHMMARDQSRRREGTWVLGVLWGREGTAGWSGGKGEVGTTDFSSLGRKPCFPTGSISVADSRTLPASCKEKEGGRKKLKDRKGWRCKSRVSPLPKFALFSKTPIRKTGSMVWWYFCESFKSWRPCKLEWNIDPYLRKDPQGCQIWTGQEQITNQVLLGCIKVWLMCVPWCLLPSRATTGPLLYCETENTQKNTQSINTQFKNLLWNRHTGN